MSAIPLEFQPSLTLPAAYRGPRGTILLALKRSGHLTARNLSDALGLSLNAAALMAHNQYPCD